jgi:predicted  nucleic acid-binding Zn-ribbon protein
MERSPRIFSRDIAGDSSFEETFSTPQKMSVKKARTPGTPDSEDEVENLTQASTTFDFSRARPAFGTPDRSTTVGPSPRRIVGVNTMPSLPSTPVLRRPALSSDAFMTPARSSSYGSAQTPRSILRPFNTPATGNSVRFNSVTYFKVIERLPEFNPTSSPQENLGDEGTTALGIEPEERSEVPMVEHLSDDDLDFVPTHHNTIDSISSDGFSDEVERNTLANSHTTVNPDGTPMIIEEITQSCVSNASLEATTRWLEEFVAENKLVKKERSVSDGTQRTVSISTQRTVSTSTQRTVSSSSLAPLDMDSPIRHASPLIPAVDDTADVSNINNSSEWVVPTDLSFGNASLPRFEASVAITEMADPDATAATVRGSGIVPRRPQSLPLWTVPTIATSPPRDGEITPVGPRTRIAASKYISTTPLKHAPTSPFSPRRPTEDKENASVTVASTVTMSPPLTSPLKTSPPSLPAVSEDEEENDATAIRVEVTKQSMFGSLSHTGPSTAPSTLASLRLSRALLEDEDDRLPESPTPNKLALEGATVAALTGDISKLSLVDVSGNVSKLSFLDDSKVLAKSGSPGLSASASANRSALSTTSSAAIFEAQSMIAAQAQHIRNLEAELADMKKVQDEYVTEVTDREAALSKFLGPEDVTRMAGKVDGLRRENRELRAELTSAKKSVSEAEAKQTTTDSDRSRLEVIAREAEHEAQELRAQLADAEHAKEELQGEVNALRATHAEGVEDKLKDTEAELAAKLDQLEHFGRDAASAMERAETAETKLQTVQDEAARLGTDLEASRAECERLRAELDATKAAASSTASADLAAAHLEITEFKAQLAYESETKGELRSALADAHAEAASLRAQIADSRGVAGDAEVEARAARDEAADVASQLDRALADLESARADYDRLQEDAEVHAAAATREGVARVEAERQFGSVRDELVSERFDQSVGVTLTGIRPRPRRTSRPHAVRPTSLASSSRPTRTCVPRRYRTPIPTGASSSCRSAWRALKTRRTC